MGFTAANHGVEPSATVFFFVDMPGAVVSCFSLACFVRIKQNGVAILSMFALMIGFLVVILIATLAFDAGWLDYFAWQLLVGMGLFGAFSMMATPVYDRLVGLSSMQTATCTFLVLMSDGSGYVGSFALLVWKTFSAHQQSAATTLSMGAVLTLSAPVEYTETIRPVCLPADPSDTFVDRVARCTGWGGLLNGGFPDELMEVDVKVISNDECRNSYYRISDDIHICTTGHADPAFGTRGGDSGSPLNLFENGRYAAIGVNSFNSDPDAFSKVTPDVKAWIQSIAAATEDSNC